MKDPLFHTVKQFLERHHIGGSLLLLGLSGGSDSLTLLHLLLEYKKKHPFDLHVAHVDHGWRKESRVEAELLGQLVKEWGVAFHLHALEGHPSSNLEDHGRQERLKFFYSIYQEKQCQALLLAHHADDQAETVLKRLCEGASLFSLSGMHPVSQLEGMEVWRPLLSVPKHMLEEWLTEREITPFSDPSNRDLRFLRARMREEILPDLTKRFGKEISGNFLRLGRAAQEMKEYLERRLALQLAKIEQGEGVLDLKGVEEKLEQRMLVRYFLEKQGASISYEGLETLLHLLESRASKRSLAVRGGTLSIDKGILWLTK